jgi:hypothetical protein
MLEKMKMPASKKSNGPGELCQPQRKNHENREHDEKDTPRQSPSPPQGEGGVCSAPIFLYTDATSQLLWPPSQQDYFTP